MLRLLVVKNSEKLAAAAAGALLDGLAIRLVGDALNKEITKPTVEASCASGCSAYRRPVVGVVGVAGVPEEAAGAEASGGAAAVGARRADGARVDPVGAERE